MKSKNSKCQTLKTSNKCNETISNVCENDNKKQPK